MGITGNVFRSPLPCDAAVLCVSTVGLDSRLSSGHYRREAGCVFPRTVADVCVHGGPGDSIADNGFESCLFCDGAVVCVPMTGSDFCLTTSPAENIIDISKNPLPDDPAVVCVSTAGVGCCVSDDPRASCTSDTIGDVRIFSVSRDCSERSVIDPEADGESGGAADTGRSVAVCLECDCVVPGKSASVNIPGNNSIPDGPAVGGDRSLGPDVDCALSRSDKISFVANVGFHRFDDSSAANCLLISSMFIRVEFSNNPSH